MSSSSTSSTVMIPRMRTPPPTSSFARHARSSRDASRVTSAMCDRPAWNALRVSSRPASGCATSGARRGTSRTCLRSFGSRTMSFLTISVPTTLCLFPPRNTGTRENPAPNTRASVSWSNAVLSQGSMCTACSGVIASDTVFCASFSVSRTMVTSSSLSTPARRGGIGPSPGSVFRRRDAPSVFPSSAASPSPRRAPRFSNQTRDTTRRAKTDRHHLSCLTPDGRFAVDRRRGVVAAASGRAPAPSRRRSSSTSKGNVSSSLSRAVSAREPAAPRLAARASLAGESARPIRPMSVPICARSSRVEAWASPTTRSSARPSGHERGAVSHISARTKGTQAAASRVRRGPVNTALGRISPNTSTSVTLTTITEYFGKIVSRHSGKASLAAAFTSRSVQSSQWCSATTSQIFFASSRSRRRAAEGAEGSSASFLSSSSIGSTPSRPTVRPAIVPATSTRAPAPSAYAAVREPRGGSPRRSSWPAKDASRASREEKARGDGGAFVAPVSRARRARETWGAAAAVTRANAASVGARRERARMKCESDEEQIGRPSYTPRACLSLGTCEKSD